MNILDMLKDQVTGTLANQASGFLGESEGAVKTALGSAFPAILGSVIEKGNTQKGAEGLMGMIDGLDLGMLGNIGNIFGGGASSVNGLLNSGGGILDMVLGNKLGGVADMIAKVAGLKGGSSSSLLKMAAPFVISMIGKQVRGKGIGALMDLLKGQKSNVSSALPAGMGSILGLSSFGNDVADTTRKSVNTTTTTAKRTVNNTANTTAKAANNGLGWLKYLLPLLLIGALLWWFFMKGGAQKTAEVAGDAVEVTKDAAVSVADGVGNAAGAVVDFAANAFSTVDEAAKAALDKITFTAGSAGSQIMDFINGGFKGNGIFRFKNLNFATGSAELNADAQSEVDNLAAILKAYPNVNVEIHGHTDNTGDAAANKQLSQARAASVQARLIADGITASRMKAMGYGSENPVADNGTAEGRAENRRIEVRLVK